MECTGKITGIGIDYNSRKFTLSLMANENISAEYEKLKDCEKVRVIIKKYRNKRSLDANAYAWVLMQKIAEAVHSDKDTVYLKMLARYGQFTHIVVKPDAVERMKQEWRTIRELGEITVGSMTGIQLQCYFGSSTYDSKEMSVFVDGIASECRELGIETDTPDELARMKREWGVDL